MYTHRLFVHPEVGADYLGSPAVYATVTKPGAPEAGLDMLRQTKAWIEAELSKQDRVRQRSPVRSLRATSHVIAHFRR